MSKECGACEQRHSANDPCPPSVTELEMKLLDSFNQKEDLFQKLKNTECQLQQANAKLAVAVDALKYSWPGSYGKDVNAFNGAMLAKIAAIDASERKGKE